MYIENLSIEQILVAIIFIAGLIFLQIYISKNKSTIRGKWSSGKRIEISETTRLGPTEKLQIINIDNRDYFYFFAKGNQPVIIPADTTQRLSTKKNDPAKTLKAPIISSKIQSPKVSQKALQNTSQKSNTKIMQAISAARKLNPKVSFE
tara:strand:+ start:214 stop:660 length:447 start_codon:yes stop_codon:yes gene_type:complete